MMLPPTSSAASVTASGATFGSSSDATIRRGDAPMTRAASTYPAKSQSASAPARQISDEPRPISSALRPP
jgi:hypothetical protein